jgi:hypothetical protein
VSAWREREWKKWRERDYEYSFENYWFLFMDCLCLVGRDIMRKIECEQQSSNLAYVFLFRSLTEQPIIANGFSIELPMPTNDSNESYGIARIKACLVCAGGEAVFPAVSF